MLVIERCYSDRPDDIFYTLSAYLLLLEKICGIKINEASQDRQEEDKKEGVK